MLFQFEPDVALATTTGPSFRPTARVPRSPNLVFINVSPIEYGHVLLVPRALDQMTQLVTPEDMQLALQFAREAANPYFRVRDRPITENSVRYYSFDFMCSTLLNSAPAARLQLAWCLWHGEPSALPGGQAHLTTALLDLCRAGLWLF